MTRARVLASGLVAFLLGIPMTEQAVAQSTTADAVGSAVSQIVTASIGASLNGAS